MYEQRLLCSSSQQETRSEGSRGIIGEIRNGIAKKLTHGDSLGGGIRWKYDTRVCSIFSGHSSATWATLPLRKKIYSVVELVWNRNQKLWRAKQSSFPTSESPVCCAHVAVWGSIVHCRSVQRCLGSFGRGCFVSQHKKDEVREAKHGYRMSPAVCEISE